MKLTTLLLASAFVLPAVLLAAPTDPCAARVRQINTDYFFQQINIEVSVPPTCPLEGRAVIRFRTAGGGIVPDIGYIVLRSSFPSHTAFWLRRGASVEQKKQGGKWNTIWRSGE